MASKLQAIAKAVVVVCSDHIDKVWMLSSWLMCLFNPTERVQAVRYEDIVQFIHIPNQKHD